MKKTISLILAVTIALTLAVSAFAARTEPASAADKLHTLGLFQGTGSNADGTPNYDLACTPTRAEAVTMLVRLLGKEAEANGGAWTTPFTDVADWAKPYVGYAYTNELTNGTSETSFSGSSPITAPQYITLVLRALGYADGADFAWDSAWTLSDKLGFTDGRYKAGAAAFTRGDVASISFDALSAADVKTGKALYEVLLDSKAVTADAVKSVGLNAVQVTGLTLNVTTATVEIGKTISLTATVSPADADNKTVTWTSSNTSVATVSQSGVVTGVKIGNATITAKTANDKSAACAVTVTEAVKFTVPKLNYEYGPLTITDEWFSGNFYTHNISSFVFTKLEPSAFSSGSLGYKVTASIQGISTSNNSKYAVNYLVLNVYFYDANGRALGEERLQHAITQGSQYSVLITDYWDTDVVENAARIEFYSNSGRIANSGGGEQPSDPTPTTPPTTTPPATTTPTPTPPPSHDYPAYSRFPEVPDAAKVIGTLSLKSAGENTHGDYNFLYATPPSMTEADLNIYYSELVKWGFSLSTDGSIKQYSKTDSAGKRWLVSISILPGLPSAGFSGSLIVGVTSA
ncbi:MAG: Ig-like domain-containing protein [Oscillospiraceae bacterium]|jgi:hypothetical protein|nr:Ig-like domain-containing protein [Oscillospiraceae bacterium]